MATTYSDVQTTSGMPLALRNWYTQEIIHEFEAQRVYDQFCEVWTEPGVQHAQTVYRNIYRGSTPKPAVLSETVDDDAENLTNYRKSVTVYEHGWTTGTTELLDLMNYNARMSEICRQEIARNMTLTLDVLARNAMLSQSAAYTFYGGTATSKATLTESCVLTEAIFRKAAREFARENVPGDKVCIAHPDATYHLKDPANTGGAWIDIAKYQAAQAVYNNEVGKLWGFRVIETTLGILPNGCGTSSKVQTTLSASAAVGATTISVASATGLSAKYEITISNAAVPSGTANDEETVRILAIDGTTLTLAKPLVNAHASGAYVTYDVHCYPVIFLANVPGAQAVAKGVALEPELRVPPVMDRKQRFHYFSWYGVLGYGIIRPEQLLVWYVGAARNG